MVGLLALAFCLPGDASGRIPVVVTTDCGVEVDDQWALAHLALSPRIDLRAVVTTHAGARNPAAADASAKSAQALLDALPLTHRPPVLAGSGSPLNDRKTPIRNPGVDLLLKESQAGNKGRRVVVLTIGAATDVASALLLDPAFADRVEVVAMGFDGWPGGGDSWNVKNDVRAWQVLLDSPAPLVVGDARVGKRDLAMTPADARRRLEGTGAAGNRLIELLEKWLDGHRELVARTTGNPRQWPIWDEVTVAHLLGLTDAEVRPRPTLRDDLSLDHSRPRGSITWIKSLRTDALWADLRACLRPLPLIPDRACPPRTTTLAVAGRGA